MKRIALIVYGPLVLLFFVILAALFKHNKKFEYWYIAQIKRWSEHVLWVLDIEIILSKESDKIFSNADNVVLVANHRSHLDSMILWAICPTEKHLIFAAKKELFNVPLLGSGLRQAKAISVDRSNGRKALSSLIDGTNGLHSNEILVVFPEGTRGGKKLRKFKRGAFSIALKSHRGIMPVCIKETDNLFPKGRVFPSKGKVYVNVCNILSYHDIEGFSDLELSTQVREIMHSNYFSEEPIDLSVCENCTKK